MAIEIYMKDGVVIDSSSPEYVTRPQEKGTGKAKGVIKNWWEEGIKKMRLKSEGTRTDYDL